MSGVPVVHAVEGSTSIRGRELYGVSWRGDEDSVHGQVSAEGRSVAFTRHADVPAERGRNIHLDERLFVRVWLETESVSTGRECVLHFEAPLDGRSGFSGPIARWPTQTCPQPVPARRAPEEEGPAPTQIVDPRDTRELFPFVWLDEVQSPGDPDAVLSMPSAAKSAVVQALEKASASKSVATMRAAARAQARGDASALDAAAAAIGALRAIEVPPDDVPALLLEIERALGHVPAKDFVQRPAVVAAVPIAWDELLILSWVGESGDAETAGRRVDGLRVTSFLQRAVATPESLLDRTRRRVLLDAVPLLPASCTVPAAAREVSTKGWAAPLGIGRLQVLLQRLQGYRLGELAEVRNVLPRERRRRLQSTRDWEHRGSDSSEQDTEGRSSDEENRTSTGNENDLAAAFDDLQLERDLTDVKPSYQDLQMALSGKWSGSDRLQARKQRDLSRFTERALQRARECAERRVARRRGERLARERVVREDCLQDNSGGEAKLTNLYRWVDERHQFQLMGRGRRLVIGVLLDDPARSFRQRLRRDPDPRLAPPERAEALDKGAASLTAANYVAQGLLYGLRELPVPGGSVALKVDAGAPSSSASLPVGSTVVAVTGSYVLADGSRGLAGVFAGKDFVVAPVAAAAPSGSGASGSKSGGDTPSGAPVPAPAAGSLSLSAKDVSPPDLRLVANSSSSQFEVLVRVDYQLATPSDAFSLWQSEVFQRLQEAYLQADRAHRQAVERREEELVGGDPRAAERDSLRTGTLDLLASWPLAKAETPEPAVLRFLDRSFGWDDATVSYDPWPAGAPRPVAADWPSSAPARPAGRPDADGRRFRRFLDAGSARLLLPVRPGQEFAVLAYFFFAQPWIGSSRAAVSASTAREWIESWAIPERPADEPLDCSTIDVPTTLRYVQADDRLPTFFPEPGS